MVLMFCFFVHFDHHSGMIAQREFTRYFENLEQVFSKFLDELRLVSTDDVIWKDMIFENFPHNKICHVLTSKGLHTWKEMCLLSEVIYHSGNGIITLGEWEIYNEIQRYIFPRT